MKKAFLTILWTITISGSVFLITHKIKEKVQQNTTETEKTITLENENTLNTISRISEDTSSNDQSETTTSTTTQNYEEIIALGNKQLQKGNLNLAIEYFNHALEIKPNSLDLLLTLGESYSKNNENKKASDTYRKALEIEENSSKISLLLAKSLFAEFKIEEAKKILWAIDKDNVEARLYQGISYIVYKKFDLAEKVFTEINENQEIKDENTININKLFLSKYERFENNVDSEPLFLELMLINVLSEIDENHLAIYMLNDLIEEKNNYKDAWLLLGYNYLKIYETNEAIDALKKFLSLRPESKEGLFYIGLAFSVNEELEKAIYYLEKSKLRGYKPTEHINIKLAELYEKKANYEKSIKLYEEVLSTIDSSLDLYVKLFNLYAYQSKDFENAKKVANQCLQNFPSKAESFNLVAKSYILETDYEKAKEYIESALKIDPINAESYLIYGEIAENQDEKYSALEYYKRAYYLGYKTETGNKSIEKYLNLKNEE